MKVLNIEVLNVSTFFEDRLCINNQTGLTIVHDLYIEYHHFESKLSRIELYISKTKLYFIN